MAVDEPLGRYPVGISLTTEEIIILVGITVVLYYAGWLVVNIIIPGFLRKRRNKRKQERADRLDSGRGGGL